ncbi:MAG: VanZ family protein [Pseudomonadota bacterium]|nr:VanZ family protein [Pseudomonadota bacterium]
MTLRWAARIVLFVAAVVIADLALQPGLNLPGPMLGSDKLEHALAFLVLAILARVGWPGLPAWIAALLLMAYGLGIEAMQGAQDAGRTASLADLAADGIGVAAGLGLVRLVRGRAAGDSPAE